MKHMTKMIVFGGLFLVVIIALQYFGIGGNYLVWVAILACLGMHFFMHGGHGHDGHEREEHANATSTETDVANTKKPEKHVGHKNRGGGCCH